MFPKWNNHPFLPLLPPCAVASVLGGVDFQKPSYYTNGIKHLKLALPSLCRGTSMLVRSVSKFDQFQLICSIMCLQSLKKQWNTFELLHCRETSECGSLPGPGNTIEHRAMQSPVRQRQQNGWSYGRSYLALLQYAIFPKSQFSQFLPWSTKSEIIVKWKCLSKFRCKAGSRTSSPKRIWSLKLNGSKSHHQCSNI